MNEKEEIIEYIQAQLNKRLIDYSTYSNAINLGCVLIDLGLKNIDCGFNCGPDDSFMFCCDNGNDHLEFEIIKNDIEIFYLNRKNNEMFEDVVTRHFIFSDKTMEKIKIFVS